MAAEFCHLKDSKIEWTDFVDPSAEELEAISKKYDLNPYTLIDSLDPDHLPKYEEHNNTHFIIVRLAKEEEKQDQSIRTLSSKIALFFNDDFIITIHRAEQPLIATIREQFVDSGKISSTTGIAVRIIREALHTYEQPAMQLSDKIDFFESKLFLKKNFPANLIESIYFLKNKAGIYKKILLLSNEVVSSVKVESDDRPALRDVHDLHTKLVLLYDQVQEDANNLLNIYLSLSARKTNDVMKILTIFSVFFMPLTFIVGVYGMNFKFMPELNYRYGYPLAMLSMVVISVVIFVWFKRKKWL
ncbi:magnesium transport protein CorA [Flavobacterium noncentrifugens]|uniref:Magnesium transporter n=1 Tax=Flavobacterium noncentrifugens TaxID=1128970 RepID=A0A1G8TBY3_9FLAO|nr:CorA family divalent cation transporter [Flavobacterium noncentrifugens]GEP50166.1 magnesium transport protein CorA [Flavobacterium noncentrifugens]SDJ39008.1 magnesium transporter [Flavobacterium noncentrifugens]